MGRQDYEGAPISGVTGDVAGSTTSDYGSRNFTGSDRFDFNNDDDGGGPPPALSQPTTGLNQQQFQNRFGITNRNPYGQTGFAKFFDKFSRALGGQGVDYRPQFQSIDRMMGRDPGTTQQRMMNRQYDLYANPTINPQTGVIESGGIDRLGRGTIQAPVEEINRQQSLQEQLARGIAGVATPFGLPLSQIGTTELVDTRYVTDEMRDRGPQSMAEQLMSSLTGGADVSNLKSNATEGLGGLGERMMNLFSGGATGEAKPNISPQNIPTQSTLEMDAMSAPTNAFTNRNAPNYGMEPTSYDMVQRQNRIPTPTSIPDAIEVLRANEGQIMGPFASADVPTPLGGRRYDLPSEELDAISRNYEIDGVTGPTPDEIDGFTPQPYGFDMDAMASYRGSRATPVGPDMDATASYRGSRATPVEEGMTYLNDMYGPRTPDDLRAMGIEPSLQDLRDMGVKPTLAEVLAGLDPNKSISSDETVGISDIVQGAGLIPAGTGNVIQTESGPINLDDLSFSEKLGMIGQAGSNIAGGISDSISDAASSLGEAFNEALYGTDEERKAAAREQIDRIMQSLEEAELERGGMSQLTPSEQIQYMETLSRGRRGGENVDVPLAAQYEDYKQYGAGTQKGARILNSLGDRFRR